MRKIASIAALRGETGAKRNRFVPGPEPPQLSRKLQKMQRAKRGKPRKLRMYTGPRARSPEELHALQSQSRRLQRALE